MAGVDDDATSARFETLRDEAGECVLFVAGEVDLSNATLLRDEVEEMLVSNPSRIVLDVRELTFMDSSGLAVLLQAAAKLEALVVRNPQSSVRRMLEASGVTSVVKMEP
jgi:anti-sigma B factor antagonist